MTKEKWIYATLVTALGLCLWYDLGLWSNMAGAALVAYAARDTFKSAD